jgi:hypothetical protein
VVVLFITGLAIYFNVRDKIYNLQRLKALVDVERDVTLLEDGDVEVLYSSGHLY